MHYLVASRCHYHRRCHCICICTNVSCLLNTLVTIVPFKIDALHPKTASYAYLLGVFDSQMEKNADFFYGIFANGIPANRKFKNQIYRKRFSLCQSICFSAMCGRFGTLSATYTYVQSTAKYLVQKDSSYITTNIKLIPIYILDTKESHIHSPKQNS